MPLRTTILAALVALLLFSNCQSYKMSHQKQIVEKYMDGFRSTDHQTILSCLTDDVEWVMPGFFSHKGIEQFDKEIENPNADGHPNITISRMTEEANVVIAEGEVHAKMKDGSKLDAVFCDVFEFREGKISKLTTYLMFTKPN